MFRAISRYIPAFLMLLGGVAIYIDQISAQPGDPLERPEYVEAVADTGSAALVARHEFKVRDDFEPIVEELVKRGLPEDYVRMRFADERTEIIPKLTRVSIKSSSNGGSASAYSWVNTQESAEACRVFIDRHRSILDSAATLYGVEPELIAALMRTETRHGTVTGDYHVFSVFATTALLNQEDVLGENLDRAREQLEGRKADSEEVKEQISYVKNRSRTKANWAIGELENLLNAEREGKLDAMALKGSWAGAFGWGQFLPSSYQRRAVDGDGDGRIDLYTPADAIHSVANYLKSAGYVRGNRKRTYQALWDYNHSKAYVTSIMGLAARVKRGE